MTTFTKPIVNVLTVIALQVASIIVASTAAAQKPAPVVDAGQVLLTTSTLIGVGPTSTFESGHVHVPPCPRGQRFLATAVQAAPAFFGDDVLNLPRWAISVHLLQQTANGSFSPHLGSVPAKPPRPSPEGRHCR